MNSGQIQKESIPTCGGRVFESPSGYADYFHCNPWLGPVNGAICSSISLLKTVDHQ